MSLLSPLDRKLARDLWRIKGQAGAIAAVIALGVMTLVMMSGLVNTLEQTRIAYYERYRLPEIFAPVETRAKPPARPVGRDPWRLGRRGARLRHGAGRDTGRDPADPCPGRLPARCLRRASGRHLSRRGPPARSGPGRGGSAAQGLRRCPRPAPGRHAFGHDERCEARLPCHRTRPVAGVPLHNRARRTGAG